MVAHLRIRGAGLRRTLLASLCLFALPVLARTESAAPPRLVVVVSIDQFPQEYVARFAALFGPDGFRRLLEGGADYRDCQHGHFVTATAPGHSVMLTGTYPVHSGIVGNRWYARASGTQASAVDDPRFPVLALGGGVAGQGISPRALQVPTVGDLLRAATGLRAQVVSVAIKDRGAVLMGGQRPTGAYWFDPQACAFVTSSYYREHLPEWVATFNAARPCAGYADASWTRLRPDLDYAALADIDDAPYEEGAYGMGRTFPHPVHDWIDTQAAGDARGRYRYMPIIATPFGNQLLLTFAKAAIDGEHLGQDAIPDLLTISFSSNDYIGHAFGPNSQEALDAVLRTDQVLADLMGFLDQRIGKGEWVLALTSDHGVAPIPQFLERAGVLPERDDHYRLSAVRLRSQMETALQERFLPNLKLPTDFPGFFTAWDGATDPFIYVNPAVLDSLPNHPSYDGLLTEIAEEIEKVDGVARVFRRSERARLAESHDRIERSAYRSWHAENGGDLLVQYRPYWLGAEHTGGTNHLMPYRYDTHVPLLLYGPGIRAGRFERPVAVVDLASTLARILRVPQTPQDDGRPLFDALAN